MKLVKLKGVVVLKPVSFADGEPTPIDANALLTGVLSTLYKMDNGEIAELIKTGTDGVLTKIIDLDKSRVQTLQTNANTTATSKFQEGYAKAKKEERAALEKEIKEKYGVQTDHTGLELVDHIVSTKAGEAAKATGKAAKDLTVDEIKLTPAYQQMETAFKNQLKEKETEFENKLKEKEESYTKEATFASVSEKALGILNGLNPVLPKDATAAAKQQRWFLNDLKEYDFSIQDGKIIATKDGKVVEDAHGHTLEFEALVKGIANTSFEFAANNDGGNSGNSNEDAAGNKSTPGEYPKGIKKPQNLDELTAIVNDNNIKPEDRRIILETYNVDNGIKTSN